MRKLAEAYGKRIDERTRRKYSKSKVFRNNERVLVRTSNKKGRKTRNRRMVNKVGNYKLKIILINY